MEKALVEDAEHDVDDEDRDGQQEPEAAEGGLEDLSGPLEARCHRYRHPQLPARLLHARHRITESDARRQVEREGDGGELSQMRDGQGAESGPEARDRAERDELAVGGRGQRLRVQ